MMSRTEVLRQREAMRRRIRALLIQRRLLLEPVTPPAEPAQPRD